METLLCNLWFTKEGKCWDKHKRRHIRSLWGRNSVFFQSWEQEGASFLLLQTVCQCEGRTLAKQPLLLKDGQTQRWCYTLRIGIRIMPLQEAVWVDCIDALQMPLVWMLIFNYQILKTALCWSLHPALITSLSGSTIARLFESISGFPKAGPAGGSWQGRAQVAQQLLLPSGQLAYQH